ncbi:type II toxin-antitoxin system RelE/ParE family toxin [Candidatus Aerophobetes bacterium]|nr:type II toxin-antitoxin system RelE/ParE family toxin [Candidatus Aerophobetes bacterium]
MSYEIKLGTRATSQLKKLDLHIKEIVKRKLRDNLTLNPHRCPLLSGKYSSLRRIAFSTPGGEYRAIYTIREDKKRVVVLFVGARENFYKEFERYLS